MIRTINAARIHEHFFFRFKTLCIQNCKQKIDLKTKHIIKLIFYFHWLLFIVFALIVNSICIQVEYETSN